MMMEQQRKNKLKHLDKKTRKLCGEETEKTVKEQWRRGKWSASPSKTNSINESATLSFEGWLRNVHEQKSKIDLISDHL